VGAAGKKGGSPWVCSPITESQPMWLGKAWMRLFYEAEFNGWSSVRNCNVYTDVRSIWRVPF